MEWETLLSTKRAREVQQDKRKTLDLRSEFEKDYHRIIGSASFRRLQDKTQVFPLDKSDFIRTRLTHSLEVSSFGKSLGQNIGEKILQTGCDESFTTEMKEEICHILQCAGLIHDIGNPPFGHFGETAIREWFLNNLSTLRYFEQPVSEILTEQMQEDLYQFEGNAQALRLVTKLHYLVDEYGMNLTYALLNTIVKYPIASTEKNADSKNIKDKKMGYYYADQNIYYAVAEETGTLGKRHPLTYILEAADDLAYKTADIEDAFVKGYLSYYDLEKELETIDAKALHMQFDPLGNLRKQYARGCEKGVAKPDSYAVKNWIVRVQGFLIHCATEGFTNHYQDIMNGEYANDIFYGTQGDRLIDLLGDIAYRYVFSSSDIYRMEVTESVIIDFLMEKMVHAALYYDTEKPLNTIDNRLMRLISDNYRKAYQNQAKDKNEAEKLYLRLLLVTDYICGMTDSYAKRLYQEMKGMVQN